MPRYELLHATLVVNLCEVDVTFFVDAHAVHAGDTAGEVAKDTPVPILAIDYSGKLETPKSISPALTNGMY